MSTAAIAPTSASARTTLSVATQMGHHAYRLTEDGGVVLWDTLPRMRELAVYERNGYTCCRLRGEHSDTIYTYNDDELTDLVVDWLREAPGLT